MYIFLYLIALKETDFFYVLCVVPGNTQSPLICHCVCRRGGVGEPLAISSHCLLKSLAYKSNVSFLPPQEQKQLIHFLQNKYKNVCVLQKFKALYTYFTKTFLPFNMGHNLKQCISTLPC